MNVGDYGEDEDGSIKLLTKHKAMKLSKWAMLSTLKDNRELKDLKNTAKVRRGCLVVVL